MIFKIFEQKVDFKDLENFMLKLPKDSAYRTPDVSKFNFNFLGESSSILFRPKHRLQK